MRKPKDEVWHCMRISGVEEKCVKLVQDVYRDCVTSMRSLAGMI